jgi:prevent-host-death family protein
VWSVVSQTRTGHHVTTVSLENAGKNLPGLIDRARAGEEIIISDQDRPLIKLLPVEPSYRGFGALRGVLEVSNPDLLAPLSDDEIKQWWGSEQ